METLLIIIIAIVALLVVVGAVVAFAMQNDKRRRQLREGFGPEYHKTLSRTGDRSEAEKELKERQKRFDLRPEAAHERRRGAILGRVAAVPGAVRRRPKRRDRRRRPPGAGIDAGAGLPDVGLRSARG